MNEQLAVHLAACRVARDAKPHELIAEEICWAVDGRRVDDATLTRSRVIEQRLRGSGFQSLDAEELPLAGEQLDIVTEEKSEHE
jgi:hypothetical protein